MFLCDLVVMMFCQVFILERGINMLKEIRNKVERYKNDVVISRECCDVEDFSDEVILLLSLIDRYERTFNKIQELCANAEYSQVPHVNLDRIRQVAKVALEDK